MAAKKKKNEAGPAGIQQVWFGVAPSAAGPAGIQQVWFGVTANAAKPAGIQQDPLHDQRVEVLTHLAYALRSNTF